MKKKKYCKNCGIELTPADVPEIWDDCLMCRNS